MKALLWQGVNVRLGDGATWRVDKFPLGALMNKGLTLRGAQQHGHRYIPMRTRRLRARPMIGARGRVAGRLDTNGAMRTR